MARPGAALLPSPPPARGAEEEEEELEEPDETEEGDIPPLIPPLSPMRGMEGEENPGAAARMVEGMAAGGTTRGGGVARGASCPSARALPGA